MSFIIRICQNIAGVSRITRPVHTPKPEPALKIPRNRWMALFGGLLALSAPGFNAWLLAWIGLIPALLWTKKQHSWKTVFTGGFCLGFCFLGLYCVWFFDLHPLTWLGFTDWGSRLTTLAGWLLIAVEGGLITALVFTGYFYLKRPLIQWFLFPLAWITGFWLLHTTPMALPWGMLEYTQAHLPVMRWLAGWIGASGLSFLLLLHNAAWASYIEHQPKFGLRWARIMVVPILIGGLGLLPAFHQKQSTLPLPVAAVQANLPIEIIRSGRLTEPEIEAAYLQPLRQKALPTGTLVAYPEEGVVPNLVPENKPFQNSIMRQLHEIVQQKKISVAVGIIVQDADGQLYNSIALLNDKQAVQFYHKRKLVPFGEFTPYGFGEFLQQLLAQWNVDYHAPFSAGKKAPLLQVGKLSVGGLVCFELIDANPLSGGFAGDYQRRGAKFLLNSSNLGWFHENPFIEAQFLAIGQLRAAENRLPLVIASNTGISAIISSTGEVLARTQPFAPNMPQTQIIEFP